VRNGKRHDTLAHVALATGDDVTVADDVDRHEAAADGQFGRHADAPAVRARRRVADAADDDVGVAALRRRSRLLHYF
jgi:hypothetical protein